VARYADNLLADGEHAVLRTRQHFLATIFEGRTAWAIFIASVVLFFLSASVAPELPRQVFQWIALGLLLISLFWLLQVYASWYAEDYLVTNRRVLKVEGVFRKRSADSSLEKINDAVLEQSVLGRMLNYGDLDIMTAAETSVDTYRMLAGAPQFKKTMLDEKHSLEEEFLRVPAPPLRAAPMVSTAPADSPPPGAQPKPGMSSTEITKALGELADLRDRGAISPEDYEAKKSDLLGRI
jgi:Bacterial PH domain/Short C-terminal domain